jgi:hypothetical protein
VTQVANARRQVVSVDRRNPNPTRPRVCVPKALLNLSRDRNPQGMIGLLGLPLSLSSSPFNSQLRLEAEKAALRDQLIVLRRKVQGGSSSRK